MNEVDRQFARFRATRDPRALASLFDAVAPELLRVARYLAGDVHAGEDLVQTTFLVLIEDAASHDPTLPVLPWLLGILANRARHLRRQQARAAKSGSGATVEDPLAAAERRELEEALERALGSLGSPYREVLVLHLHHGLEAHEIAKALDRPAGTVRTQVVRGMEILRGSLPAGFAVGLAAIATTGRGLAAVRDAVLAHAGTAPIAAGSALAGGLLVKKIVALAATALLAGLVWILWPELSVGEVAREARRSSEAHVGLGNATAAAGTETRSSPSDLAPRATVEATTRSTSLAVRVRFAAGGDPAAGVSVMMAPSQGWPFGRRTATTDDTGLVEFAGLAAGAFELRSDRGGEAKTDVLSGLRNELDLEIPPGIDVQGVVVDRRDRPVAGAHLWVSFDGETIDDGLEVGQTAEDGTFSLRSIASGRYVAARADRWHPSGVTRLRGEAGTCAQVRLILNGPGNTVRGLVVDEKHQPIANAFVLLGLASRYPPTQDNLSPPSYHLQTDSRGQFLARGLHAGSNGHAIWASAPGFATWTGTLDVPSDQEGQVTIRMEPGATLQGRVLARDGTPVAQARIHARQERVWPHDQVAYHGPAWGDRRTVSDADGGYRLVDLAAGRLSVRAEAGSDRATLVIELAAREQRTQDLRLAEPPALEGFVVDERSAPLAGYQVWATQTRDNVKVPQFGETDATGRFRLEGGEDDRFEVSVSPKGCSMNGGLVTTAPVRPSDGPLRIVVPSAILPTAAVTLRLVRPDGSPVEDCSLSLTRLDPDGTVRHASRDTKARAGVLELGGLVPGQYAVRARWSDQGVWLGVHDLGPQAITDLGTYRLQAPGRVLLQVRDAQGQPVETGLMMMATGDAAAVETLVVRNGSCRSRACQPGNYRVQPWLPTWPLLAREVEIRPGEETVVTIEIPASVERKVLVAPVPHRETRLTTAWSRDGAVVDRRVSVAHAAVKAKVTTMRFVPGRYQVVVTAGSRSARAELVVDERPTADEVFTLPSPFAR